MQHSHLQPVRALVIALHVAALAAAATCLGACVVETDDNVADAPLAEVTTNGLTMNGLTMNGLSTASLTQNAALVSVLDASEDARKTFSYVIGCALPKGTDVVIPALAGQPSYTFSGELGVAPAWSHGACGTTCQGAVSACVLARVNALGQHVSISLRGNADGLSVTPAERAAYTHREATYFGNVFSSVQRLYACRTATDDQALIGRVCGQGANVVGCAVTVIGDCDAVCARRDDTDGYYSDCHAPGDSTFPRAVTVFRN